VWLVAGVALTMGAVVLPGCGKDSKAAKTDASSTTSSTASSTTTTSTTAPSTTTTAKAPAEYTLGYDAFGPLQLGMTKAAAQATGLLQPFDAGCELAGATDEIAAFKAPLSGFVEANEGKVVSIHPRSHFVTKTGGIRVGDPLSKVQATSWDGHPVELNKDGEESFHTWNFWVHQDTDIILDLLIDPGTQKVTAAGIPYVLVCD
jgi:hypothetical protein